MKQLSRNDRIAMALDEVKAAQKKACTIIRDAYPIGAAIQWDKGGHVQYGTVLYNSDFESGDRFRVQNDYTSKSYWITFYDVQLAARPRS
jgi:hypothetical protein